MNYILTERNLTLYTDSGLFVIPSDHPEWEEIISLVKTKSFAVIIDLTNPIIAMPDFTSGGVSIERGRVLLNGTVLHNALTTRIVRMHNEGFDISYMSTFLENLMQNPSFNSVNQLYQFLEKNELPITPDGCFVAYKSINDDWTDHHTSSIANTIGAVIEMPRYAVNDNPNESCSEGLHAGAFSYFSGNSNGRMISVKINPADVVSVPNDYNCAKMRVCRYEVIAELEVEIIGNKDDVLSRRVVYD